MDAVVVVDLDAGRLGVTRDVSEKGLLIATRYHFSAGDELVVTVVGPSGSVQRKAAVVRVDENAPNEEWRYRVAVALDEALPEAFIKDGMKAATQLLKKK